MGAPEARLHVELASSPTQLIEKLAHAEAAARGSSDLPAAFARRAPAFVVVLRLEDLVALVAPRARFDLAAAVFVAAGERWQHTKRQLDEAIAAADPTKVLDLREDLDACRREIDRARDAMHTARRRI